LAACTIVGTYAIERKHVSNKKVKPGHLKRDTTNKQAGRNKGIGKMVHRRRQRWRQ
jgi:hypothetical protein